MHLFLGGLIFEGLINSSPIDELGRWCPEGWWETDTIDHNTSPSDLCNSQLQFAIEALA